MRCKMRLRFDFSRLFSKYPVRLKGDSMSKRGALIVFEGCDRCGKTTQCKKLVEVLSDETKKVQFRRFPDRTTVIGKMINEYLNESSDLDDHAVHLLFSANRWEAVNDMKRLLQGGTTLIVDRYAYSGVAFTAAKPGFQIDWCKQADVGLPKPDLVIYLTISPEAAAMRGDFGNERYERSDFQLKVADNYESLKEEDWKIIDADKSIEDLHTEIKTLVEKTMDNMDKKDIGTLWT